MFFTHFIKEKHNFHIGFAKLQTSHIIWTCSSSASVLEVKSGSQELWPRILSGSIRTKGDVIEKSRCLFCQKNLKCLPNQSLYFHTAVMGWSRALLIGQNLIHHSSFCLALWVWGQDLIRSTEPKSPTLWRKKLSVTAMIKISLTKLKKMGGLAPMVLINSSFKRTYIFGVFKWLSNLLNRVKHLYTRVFCLYMYYVLMGQESLFHLANHDNYDAELIGKVFKMIILLRFKTTF